MLSKAKLSILAAALCVLELSHANDAIALYPSTADCSGFDAWVCNNIAQYACCFHVENGALQTYMSCDSASHHSMEGFDDGTLTNGCVNSLGVSDDCFTDGGQKIITGCEYTDISAKRHILSRRPNTTACHQADEYVVWVGSQVYSVPIDSSEYRIVSEMSEREEKTAFMKAHGNVR